MLPSCVPWFLARVAGTPLPRPFGLRGRAAPRPGASAAKPRCVWLRPGALLRRVHARAAVKPSARVFPIFATAVKGKAAPSVVTL